MTALKIADLVIQKELVKFSNGYIFFRKEFDQNYNKEEAGDVLLDIALEEEKGDFERRIASAKRLFMDKYYELLLDEDSTSEIQFVEKERVLRSDLQLTLRMARKKSFLFLKRYFAEFKVGKQSRDKYDRKKHH